MMSLFIIYLYLNTQLSQLSQFCGRVLMFLAHICALSERSAVNVGGKVM